ncbi:hypothetical protein NHH03_19265 [Stieleria sp. TO1_6]|uniref:hypothetical protein n=1 Tax=Stieleria tagensis TaxID=2956795 RepID=UPI00209AA7EC|nr:hypothetical protein [Stieleria tagensis]MCO8123894.1 hypothetical protein [Stieleria tagensis]
MSTSDVRNIDSLQRLRAGILTTADSWDKTLQEVRVVIHRAEEYYGDTVPSYWRQQAELADQELTAAQDHLHQKQSTASNSDSIVATDARKRVQRAKDRLRLCQEKKRLAKSLSIEIKHQCDEMLGPLADLTEHSNNLLPAAAIDLAALVDSLHRYAESAGIAPRPQDTPSPRPPSPTETND